MISWNEKEVARAAYYMGYDLIRGPEGYTLRRDIDHVETELIEMPTLTDVQRFIAH